MSLSDKLKIMFEVFLNTDIRKVKKDKMYINCTHVMSTLSKEAIDILISLAFDKEFFNIEYTEVKLEYIKHKNEIIGALGQCEKCKTIYYWIKEQIMSYSEFVVELNKRLNGKSFKTKKWLNYPNSIFFYYLDDDIMKDEIGIYTDKYTYKIFI